MEKNTKWAIGLSVLVLVVSLVIQFAVVVPKQQAAYEQQQIEQAAAAKEKEENRNK